MSRPITITSGLLKASRSQPAHVYVKPLLASATKCITCESPCAQEKITENNGDASNAAHKTQESAMPTNSQTDEKKGVQELEKNSPAAEIQMTTFSAFDPCVSRIVPSDILQSGIAVPNPTTELRAAASSAAAAIATVGAPLVSTPSHASVPVAASVTIPSPAQVPATPTTAAAPHVPWPYRLPAVLRPRAGTTFHDNYIATPGGAAHFSSTQALELSSSSAEKTTKVSIIQKILYGVPDPDGTPNIPNGDADGEFAEKETSKGLWQEMVDGVRKAELEMAKVQRSEEAMRNKRWAPSAALAIKYERLGDQIADSI